ncbi:hypothetical protein D1610_11710 [Sphingomonas gilva]|uniref:Baseplate protein n=1 Tax=Sphingomonas gilva TaxID=2305907 RepID=A0A396RLL5_9SPHN|nr:contractile injection system protein, VgrG/Pvc8 family [Sphingomonas gilva]RHW17208.1 hypothetical protein D1610_11710 [Sphingomonas gilva]
MAEDNVTLAIGGELHEGWTSCSVSRGIDAMVGSFSVTLATRWADRPERFALEAGAACEVRVGGETLITGWIDRLSPAFDARDHRITISGRDKACDLVDCSAIAKPGSWSNIALEALAAELARPFGVSVRATAPTGAPIRRFALQQGETVQAAIERLARYRGLLAVSAADGTVELITPAIAGAPVARLAEGDNIKVGAADHDVSERFSEYLAKGQASGDDFANGRTVASPSATATDPGVRRHRPLIVIGEDQSDAAGLQQRARWEATSRAGRAQPATVTVQGWRRPDGRLWAPNAIVDLQSPSLFMRGAMLIERVDLTKGDAGTEAVLALVPPAAWSQLAVPEEARASRVGAA